MRLRLPALVPVLAVLLCATAPAARAQVFGKNKVQYEALKWAVIETPHVRLHFYAEEESLARRVAALAETICVEYDGRFRLEPRARVPLLIYSTHHLFQQTNATPELLTEATGGLTELIKGRVLVPHNGSWARLQWVTRHELAHWYMLEKLSSVMRAHRRSLNSLPPLWFIEGLAEICATRWDADAEGLLRDAVTSGEALPLTKSEAITGTVLMYKEGQSFLLHLAERFGPARVFDLLGDWWRGDDFDTVYRITFGEPVERTDEAWFDALKRRYYPAIATARPVKEVAQKLTMRGHYNLGPCVLPNADPADTSLSFCYFAASENGIDLMLSRPGAKARHERRLLRGGRSPQFESFHLFQNRPSATATGLIALSSKRGGRDAIYVLDAAHGRVVRRLDFPGLVAINDPSLAPGDTAVVFSAQDYGGNSDLYRARWSGRKVALERLTHDDWDDLEPDLSPDGRWVVFASDRYSAQRRYALWRLSLETGDLECLGQPPAGEDHQPRYAPDGRWIAFRSTRGGTSDLYLRPAAPSDEVRRVTRLLGPASDPDWLPGGQGLLFTGQSAIEFQSYAVRFDPDTLAAERGTPALPPAHAAEGVAPAVLQAPASRDTSAVRRYRRRLGVDLVQNMVGVDPVLGAGGTGQIAVSDLLGDEQYYIFISNEASQLFGNFWDGMEAGVTYINQSRRLNYGAGVHRLVSVYDADLNAIRLERRAGVSLLARYPFDKFNRIEGSLLVRRALGRLLRDGRIVDVDLVSNFVSFVRDNAAYSWIGPSAGLRLMLGAGYTRDLGSGAGDQGTLLGELRRYWMPLPQFVSATRVQGQASLGRDAQRFYLGGRMTLRGYDYHTLSGLRTVVAQQELRFPLLRGLRFAFPVPWAFPPVNGTVFADAGWAWGESGVPLGGVPAYYLSTFELGPAGQGHLGSAGMGFYVGGGPYPVLRWNYIWRTQDFRRFSRRPRTQFALGYNF
jgi:Tol biopolymer transport system component